MTEWQAILVSGGGFLLVTLIGWGGILWQRNRLSGRENGVSSERQDNMEELLSNLPCQDPKYLIEYGEIRQGQEDMQLRMTRLEQTIDKSLESIGERMSNMETAIRLRKRLETET